MQSEQSRIGIGQVPIPYRTRFISTDGSGNITIDGDSYSADGALKYKMKVYDHVLILDVNGTDALVIELPSVSAAEGNIYLIRFADYGGASLQDEDDSIGDWSDLTPDADGEYAFLQAQGGQWVVLATDIS